MEPLLECPSVPVVGVPIELMNNPSTYTLFCVDGGWDKISKGWNQERFTRSFVSTKDRAGFGFFTSFTSFLLSSLGWVLMLLSVPFLTRF